MASFDSKRKTITVLSIILGLASLACMIAAFNVSTDTEYDGYAEGFYYDESDDGVCIRDCNLIGDIVIPEMLNDKEVTEIGNSAFNACRGVTSITIPDSVTSIGDSAFSDCDGLTIYCEATSQPGGWNRNWNSSECPVVWDCRNNDCADDGYRYVVVDGIRYRLRYGVAEVAEQPFSIRGDIVLSGTITYDRVVYRVKGIGASAFTYCDGLKSIVIPDSVTRIGDFAFSYCDRLKSIIIPDSVTSIGDFAFSGCGRLTIYCEATSQPGGWNRNWNFFDCPVVWGYYE